MTSGARVTAVVDTPLGALRLTARDGALTGAAFDPVAELREVPDGILARTAGQVDEYFAGRRYSFDLPLAPAGTAFQQRAWFALQAIGFGHTRSYGDLAQELASGARAVGGACRANPWVLIVPCHRAVAAGGRIGGYMGAERGSWPALKARLLAHEAALR